MMTSDGPRYDLPTMDDDSRAFWDAARERRLLIGRCRDCGRAHHYPRPFCPTCWSDDVVLEDASGRAVLYTYSTVFVNDLPPFRDKLPYVAAAVDLEEGPRLLTNVVGCEPDELAIGMALEVDYEQLTDEITVPVFRAAR
jgi:uncharacterized OB-fold protein